jgi:hypothetical protein
VQQEGLGAVFRAKRRLGAGEYVVTIRGGGLRLTQPVAIGT